ncbi:AzlC family ABC transporter permease [Natroniella sulfidigena]|uniref:AzlC family ABC transporter permease n=1 Tax=Natroniella sulfidigena TaxID=723921 RepID=UPI00200B3474|nr:AzlC family ABC transporter permease [Natroniella sulfidigena]MCK8818021.1 AzlC family ABC transporter permease [Natroniella sulfidigena]
MVDKIKTLNHKLITTVVKPSFLAGIKKGIPIALGYIPIGITFGLMANSAGIPYYISIMMSLFVFAGASQFIAVNLLMLHTGAWEIILTTLIINLRHFLMSASLSQKLNPALSNRWRSLLAFGVTDETFSVASLESNENLGPQFLLGLNLISYGAWNLGTILGVLLGTNLPELIQNSMGIGLYAMFIGLLVPSLKKSPPILIIALIAIISNSLLDYNFSSLSTGWQVIISTTIAAAIGTVLFPEGVEAE